MADRAFLERLSRELTDKGMLIEAGWVSLRIAAIDPKASPSQLTEMRMAFFGGAQHLFASIMTILDPGEEPTDKDLERMDLIRRELDKFGSEFSAKYVPTKGNA